MSRNSETQNSVLTGVGKVRIALAAVVAVLVLGGIAAVFPSASNQGYTPDQPMPFSHKIHAGDNKIDCKYCHTGVEKSRHATVPSMNVCMNCHTVIRPDSPYIQQLKKLYSEGKTIEWVRVHELADFVYFSHKRHIAKGLDCINCHGDVAKMDKIQQISPLTMGWCMDCHRGKTTPANVMANIYPDMPKDGKHPPGPAAAVNCTTCHY